MGDLRRFMADADVPFEMTPLEEIAASVVQGIRTRRFWLLPESENSEATIRRRADSMLARSNPDYMIDQLPVAAGGLGQPEA